MFELDAFADYTSPPFWVRARVAWRYMTGQGEGSSGREWRARAKALARAAFGSRRSGGDLAQLVHDSLIDADAVASDHYLKFETTDLAVHVHVATGGDHTQLCGRVEPADARTAVLQCASDSLPMESTTSPLGTFCFPEVGHGLVRVRIDAPEQPAVWSDWFRI